MKKEKPKATVEQLEIAKAYHIPRSQAHTVNIKKATEYINYISSPEGKLEQFLKSMEGK